MANDKIESAQYVKTLVDAGMEKKEATKAVDSLIEKINEVMAGETLEARNNIMSIKIREKIAGAKSTKHRATVIAVTSRDDANGYARRKALELFATDRDAALTQGLVRVGKDSTPVVLDNRRYFDKANTMENRGYGKPLPIKMQREFICIINGKIVDAFGDVSVSVGSVYDMYGGISEKSGKLYVNNEPSPKLVKTLAMAEFYEEVYNAAKTSDIAMDVAGALETDIRGIVMVKGYAHSVGSTQSGGARIALNTETGVGLTAFSAMGNDDAVKEMLAVPVGFEIIAVGRVKDAKDPKYGRQLTCFGVAYNPKSSGVTDALDKLKDYEF